MIHSFTATAYEVAEVNYSNLIDLGFIGVEETVSSEVRNMTIYLRDKINEIDVAHIGSSIKLNDYDMINYFAIQPAISPTNEAFVIRVGEDSSDAKAIINTTFTLQSATGQLPDLYFNITDQNIHGVTVTNQQLKDIALDMVSDSTLTFDYQYRDVQIGDFFNIDAVYIENKIESFIGPKVGNDLINFSSRYVMNEETNKSEQHETLKFFVVDFKKKVIKNLYRENNIYYESPSSSIIINHFDEGSLYEIYDKANPTTKIGLIRYVNNGELVSVDNEDNLYSIKLIPNINNYLINHDATGVQEFNDIPVIDLNNIFYQGIELGPGVYLNCAYQNKITVYNSRGD